MDVPQKHCAKWKRKKTDTKHHKLYIIAFIWNIKNIQKYWDRKPTGVFQDWRGKGIGNDCFIDLRVSFWGDEKVLELDGGGDCTMWMYQVLWKCTFLNGWFYVTCIPLQF